jgi:glucokinase
MKYLIGIDIGGTNIRCALFPQELSKFVRVEKISTQNPADPNEKPVQRLVKCIKQIWPQDGEVLGMCAAAPGSIDYRKGMVLLAPNIPGWAEFPLRDILQKEFNTEIIIENDANMAGYAEFKLGAGKGHQNMLYYTVSTGLGGGIIVTGKLLQGEIGIATEVGHIVVHDKGALCGCGKKGHWEAYSSGTGIENFVKDQIAEKPALGNAFSRPDPRTAEIAQAARDGNALAKSAFERAGYYMGIGVSNYLHIFNPSCVVFGGGVTRSWDLLSEHFHASLEEHVLNRRYIQDLKIAIAELGDDAGLIGCAEFLRDQLFDH